MHRKIMQFWIAIAIAFVCFLCLLGVTRLASITLLFVATIAWLCVAVLLGKEIRDARKSDNEK